MSIELEIRFGDGRQEQRTLAAGRYIIGRDSGDLVLGDPGMSSRHAELEVSGNAVTLTDLGSTNGTFDGQMRLSGPTDWASNRPLRLGTTLLTWAVAAAGATRSAASSRTVAPAGGAGGGARILALVALAGMAGATVTAWAARQVWRSVFGADAGSRLEVDGFRIGMKLDEALSACGTEKRLFNYGRLVAPPPRQPVFSSTGRYLGGSGNTTFPRPPDPAENKRWWDSESSEAPPGGFLESMRCVADDGTHYLEFTRPPSGRVFRIQYGSKPGADLPTAEDYERELVGRYGEPTERGAPLADGTGARQLRWRFAPEPETCRGAKQSDGWDECITATLTARVAMQEGEVSSTGLGLDTDAEERVRFNQLGPQ